MQSAVTKEEAEAYLKEVDVSSMMTQAPNAAAQAKARELLKFFAPTLAARLRRATVTKEADAGPRRWTCPIMEEALNSAIEATREPTKFFAAYFARRSRPAEDRGRLAPLRALDTKIIEVSKGHIRMTTPTTCAGQDRQDAAGKTPKEGSSRPRSPPPTSRRACARPGR